MSKNITLFASGRVAVLSTKLFGQDKFNRLAEASSLDNAVKILYENNYAGGMSVASPTEYEQLLEKELDILLSFFAEMSPNQYITDCFIADYDYTNAKIFEKARRMGVDALEKAYCHGSIDKTVLRDFIESNNYSELPISMQNALKAIDRAYENGVGSPQFIDTTLDKAKYEHIFASLSKTRSKVVTEYFVAEVDMLNVLTAFRCAAIHFDKKRFEPMLIGGGQICLEKLVEAYEKGVDALNAFVGDTRYKKIGELAYESVKEHKPLVNAELACLNTKKQILTPYKNDMESVFPLVNYFMSKKTEIENIRWILVGVKNKVEEEIIKTRIKELYV